ncbi:MAG: hypothetical protein ABL982_21230 [Vicinamibacterales bacterium]
MATPTQPARLVVHYRDGLILKGFSNNFDPGRSSFALTLRNAVAGDTPVEVRLSDLKAVFFVEDFEGEPQYTERKEFLTPAAGRRMAVTFMDGEVLWGTSLTYHPASTGFFLFPGDPWSNNDKVFVVSAAVTEIGKAS